MAPGTIETVADSADVAPWKQAVAQKQAQIKAAMPTAWKVPVDVLAPIDLSRTSMQNVFEFNVVRRSGLLSERELELTEKYTATQLLAKLAAREVTSLELTLALSKRAAIAQQILSCLTETFFDKAQERAKFLDDYLEKEGKVYGPLHGLPISLKDSFKVQGVQATIGFVSFLKHPLPTTNSAVVDMLLDMGAVLYVKTNIPQTMLSADSENNIFGSTRNPHKLCLTAGGSTGGEGALVAFGGSVLGVGTDLAGSVRIPSICCGIYGFKPSSGRVPYGNQATYATPGMPSVIPSAGPMARSVADLKCFFNTVVAGRPWTYDATAHAVPYQTTAVADLKAHAARRPGGLTIGLLPEDPASPLHPPVRRALAAAAAALVAAGHTVVPLPFSRTTSIMAISAVTEKLFSVDPTKPALAQIYASGEPIIPSVAISVKTSTGAFIDQRLSLEEVAALRADRAAFQDGWRVLFRSLALDVVLCPGAAHTAPRMDDYPPMPSFTSAWNFLDYPACIIPYGKASKTLDPDDSAHPNTIHPKYDAELFDGAPTCIQVVAPNFMDEVCLEAAEIIDVILHR